MTRDVRELAVMESPDSGGSDHDCQTVDAPKAGVLRGAAKAGAELRSAAGEPRGRFP